MTKQLLILFVVFNILNVIIQTVKSIATIKCGKTVASIVNAVAYGLYTYIVVLTMCDLPLLWKCFIVAGCNFVGVFTVKWFEEKARKDKLWKVEATVTPDWAKWLISRLKEQNIPYNYIDVEKWVIFNIYCATQNESKIAKAHLDVASAKYFVSESKTL